jgi:hypothetical protein
VGPDIAEAGIADTGLATPADSVLEGTEPEEDIETLEAADLPAHSIGEEDTAPVALADIAPEEDIAGAVATGNQAEADSDPVPMRHL